MSEHSRKFPFLRGCACLLAAALVLPVSPSEAGQKNKNQKNSDASDNSMAVPLPETPQVQANKINEDIGEMLGAFQIGNAELMHKYYSDDCTFVQSTYDPPVVGWQNYVALYNQEKASFEGMELIRRNTNIFVHGDVAWASYQWQFDSSWHGQPYITRGQTTLVFTKVNGNWLIVHNHTNEVMAEPKSETTAETPTTPQPAPVAAKP
ncbi:MAG: nuclear transport factor 2 family protein [Candidatus Acidiferrales bacterium]